MLRDDARSVPRAGIVLAGGAGRRLGRPKASLPLGGSTLVERSIAALEARCDEVVVVTRPGVPLPPLGVRVLMDRPGPDAPLTGLATGLGATTADEVLVLACDLPMAAPALERLLAERSRTPLVAWAPGAGLQPLCARYPRARALAVADDLLTAGAVAMRDFVAAIGAERVLVPDPALANVNTPGDLAALGPAA